MIAYEPRIEVRLIKAIKRQTLVEGIPVQLDRFGNLNAIDLTPYLSEHGGVRTSKSVREPAGAFSITLSDQPHAEFLETLYGMIEPMDMVEIRFAHDPSSSGIDYSHDANSSPEPGSAGNAVAVLRETTLPIIMRGFVSSVVRNQIMSGDRPMRTVTVAGQDFGKILGLIQIFYLNNSVVGDNILSVLTYFQKYSENSQAKIVSASEFVLNTLRSAINPYMSGILKLADGRSVGAAVINELKPDIAIKGSVSPYTVCSFGNTSLYAMISEVIDVGPFNEMFVEDRADGPYLVVRPTPFIAAGGRDNDFVQENAWARYVDIPYSDVVAMNVSRGDQGVANYFWVSNSRWSFMQNQRAQELAQTGNPDSFILFEYGNCKAGLYGIRKMQVDTVLGHPDYSHSDSPKSDVKQKDTAYLMSWIDERRKALADMNKDNVLFESGSIRLRGNEAITAGCYLRTRQGASVARYYVSRVDHEYTPFQGFFTTVSVERGTGFIERAQIKAPFYNEMEVGGLR